MSVYEPLASVPRGTIAVVGPDGAGKSTIVESLVDLAEAADVDVVRSHFKPGVLVRTSDRAAAPVQNPHSQTPRSIAVALPRTLAVWLDFLTGSVGPWRRAGRRGLLVLERPWLDQAVDPRRYRLPLGSAPWIHVLGRFLPKADTCLELTGDAEKIHDRKPEIGVSEVARQQQAWLRLAPAVGKQVIRVDAVAQSADQASDQIVAALQPPPGVSLSHWSAPWGYPGRIGMRVSSGVRPRAALTVYPPQKRAAVIRNRIAGFGVALGLGAPADEPPVPVEEILARLHLRGNAVAAMRSSRGGRWILGIERAGELAVIAKCGSLGDSGLRNEAAALTMLSGASPDFRLPELLFSGEIDNAFVVALRSAPRTRYASKLDVDRAAAIATTMTLGIDPVGPIVHGDFAEWNLLTAADGITLIDWEAWRAERAPLWDLSHYVVQHAALVRKSTVREVLRTLTSPGSPGAQHLEAVGEPVESAIGHLRSYLELAPRTDAGAAFRAKLAGAIA